MDESPKINYLKSCIREQHIVLPLLNKVRGKTLCLQSYALSKAHCRALAHACSELNEKIINRVFFENCGIDDEEFSYILKALLSLGDFKSIIYKQN